MSDIARQLTREAMDKTEWRDKVKAKEVAWKLLQAHANREALLDEYAQYGISTMIDELWRSQEVPEHIKRDAKPTLVRRPTVYARNVQARVREWLMDERIADGLGGTLIVREATKQQLEHYGHRMVSSGQTQLKRGHYFVAVAELLKRPKDKVGEVLTENDLQRMWKKQGLTLSDRKAAGAA